MSHKYLYGNIQFLASAENYGLMARMLASDLFDLLDPNTF